MSNMIAYFLKDQLRVIPSSYFHVNHMMCAVLLLQLDYLPYSRRGRQKERHLAKGMILRSHIKGKGSWWGSLLGALLTYEYNNCFSHKGFSSQATWPCCWCRNTSLNDSPLLFYDHHCWQLAQNKIVVLHAQVRIWVTLSSTAGCWKEKTQVFLSTDCLLFFTTL